MRPTIKHKALKCIDEVYPDDNSINYLNFPLDDFLDEAARRIIRAVPVHALGSGKDLSGAKLYTRSDGSGKILLPVDFLRLICFRMQGWQRPVITPIRADHPQYKKQFNPITRGGVAKPVVALINGDRELEYFSLPENTIHRIEQARYYGFSSVDIDYPPPLVDVTAWQLAALVLSSMADVNGANICQNKVNEFISLL